MLFLNILCGVLFTMTSSVTGLTSTSATVSPREEIMAQFRAEYSEIDQNHFYKLSEMEKLVSEYTDEELECIYQDYQEIKKSTFEGVANERSYLAVAGGPCSGKSTYLDQLRAKGVTRAFIDPDHGSLLHMKHTYLETKQSEGNDAAYTKWRGASNYIANLLLAIAFQKGYAVAHGTTLATPPSIDIALKSIFSDYKYETSIYHLTCPDEIRQKSRTSREEGVGLPVTDEDFEKKQEKFWDLLKDYPQYSTHLVFVYRGSMDEVVEAAKIEDGKLSVSNEEAFDAIRQLHDAAKGDGYFDKSLAAFK